MLATVAWSLSGLFTRLLTTDIWTAIAGRSFFGGLFLLIPYLFMKRTEAWKGFVSIGRSEALLCISLVVCQACTVGAFYLTSVANVAVIYATAPFIAAGLAWWFFGEKLRTKTLIAALISTVGVIVVVAGSFGGGHILGDLLALGMAVSFALVIVIPRAKRDLPMLPTTILSAFVTVIVFAPFSAPASLEAENWQILALFGLTNFVIALFLFLHGARRIPSAEAALIGTLEIVLSPIWVWAIFAERPTNAALAGGAAIFGAVLWHTVGDWQKASSSV